jgi:hypothetical protein
MSRRTVITTAVVLAGAICFLWLGTFLQRMTTDLFTSPDETAVMRFARGWEFGNGMTVQYALSQDLPDFEGLHARSIVRDGDRLEPVGFLGMPIIVGLAEKIAAGFGAFVTPMLVLSSIVPLYLLARRRNRRVAVISVLVYLTFPVVLLYSNRALFPNLPVVALALWAVWAWNEVGRRRFDGDRKTRILISFSAVVAGLSTGLALLIRPVEAVWIIPWAVWAYVTGHGQRNALNAEGMRKRNIVIPLFIAMAVMIIILGAGWYVALQTYGDWYGLFPVGYLIHDRPRSLDLGTTVPMVQNASPSFVLPFGFHPRTLWVNLRAYLVSAFGLWFGLAVLGAALAIRKRKGFDRPSIVFFGLVGWTAFVLLLLYGQSVYTDNINGGVTIGNSFMRYLLPLVPLIAVGCAEAIAALDGLRGWRGTVLVPIAASLLVVLGIVTAFARDNEGLIQTRYELARYVAIRAAAEQMIPSGSIILSERSDKIFELGPFVAVSPIPPASYLDRLRASGAPVYYFTRTFGPDESTDPVVARFENVTPLFTQLNETMYRLQATKPQ